MKLKINDSGEFCELEFQDYSIRPDEKDNGFLLTTNGQSYFFKRFFDAYEVVLQETRLPYMDYKEEVALIALLGSKFVECACDWAVNNGAWKVNAWYVESIPGKRSGYVGCLDGSRPSNAIQLVDDFGTAINFASKPKDDFRNWISASLSRAKVLSY